LYTCKQYILNSYLINNIIINRAVFWRPHYSIAQWSVSGTSINSCCIILLPSRGQFIGSSSNTTILTGTYLPGYTRLPVVCHVTGRIIRWFYLTGLKKVRLLRSL